MGQEKSGTYAHVLAEVQLNEDHHSRSSRFSGWRGTVMLGALTALLVLVINTAVLIWTISRFSLQYGIATVFPGSCKEAARISTATHLVINILSSLLLAASNNGMQVLVAPTREDIDRAHAKRKLMDVGVHTLRNLTSIKKRRLFVWMIIGLSSVPLHLLYNSVVFEIANDNSFMVVTVSQGFTTGSFWNQTRADNCGGTGTSSRAIQSLQRNLDGLIRLENADCIAAFDSGIQSAYGNVVAVSSSTTDETVLNITDTSSGGNWICDAAGSGTEYCDFAAARANASGWTLPGNSQPGYVTPDTHYKSGLVCNNLHPNENFPISHCLVQPVTEHCQIGMSVIFLGIVVAFNALKAVFLFITALKMNQKSLVTVGDAIESFLDRPDPSTAGYCLLTRATSKGWTSKRACHPTVWRSKKERGFSAASTVRWIVCSSL
jgi:hypothetical protein